MLLVPRCWRAIRNEEWNACITSCFSGSVGEHISLPFVTSGELAAFCVWWRTSYRACCVLAVRGGHPLVFAADFALWARFPQPVERVKCVHAFSVLLLQLWSVIYFRVLLFWVGAMILSVSPLSRAKHVRGHVWVLLDGMAACCFAPADGRALVTVGLWGVGVGCVCCFSRSESVVAAVRLDCRFHWLCSTWHLLRGGGLSNYRAQAGRARSCGDKLWELRERERMSRPLVWCTGRLAATIGCALQSCFFGRPPNPAAEVKTLDAHASTREERIGAFSPYVLTKVLCTSFQDKWPRRQIGRPTQEKELYATQRTTCHKRVLHIKPHLHDGHYSAICRSKYRGAIGCSVAGALPA